MGPWLIPLLEAGGTALAGYLSGQHAKKGAEYTGYLGGDPMGYLKAIPGELQKYFGPYAEMVQQPTGIMERIGSQYKESPGYQFELGQEQKAVGQAAAAGGMAGSPMQQQEEAQVTQSLASKDYQDYLRNALNVYMTGAGGYGRLGEDIASSYLSQSQLANMEQLARQRAQEQGESGFGSLLGAGLGGAASILGNMKF